MNTPAGELRCRNCKRPQPEDALDPRGWCSDCREEVVRRATVAGRVMGVLAAVLAVGLVVVLFGLTTRILIVWVAVMAAVYFLVYTIARRVAFELIRGRGVPPPKS